LIHLYIYCRKRRKWLCPVKSYPLQQSRSVADKLERRLAKIQAAQRRKFINEDILRLEKNGDISYETIRTFPSPASNRSAGVGFYESPLRVKWRIGEEVWPSLLSERPALAPDWRAVAHGGIRKR
jgi:hypothetical protein